MMSTEKNIETEVCVVGGGPAGSIIAMSLARLGHEVYLLEKSAFPRPHVGESLPPSILPLLGALGVRERVESARFIRPSQAIIRWSDRHEITKQTPAVPGLLVDRGEFDHLLLMAAQEAGVKIIQPAQASAPVACENGWLIRARGAASTFAVRTNFLVNAAGRSLIMKGRRKRTSTPTLAVYGYWKDTGYLQTETLVEAGPAEWYWGSPLRNDLFNAMVFIDPKRCAGTANSIEVLYRRLLDQSSLLRGCLRGTLASSVTACNASAFFDADCVGSTFIKVGEASLAVDPLSSQGIQVAIQSAAQGAIVVHTLLEKPAHAAAALEFYCASQYQRVVRYGSTAADSYAQQHSFRASPFWAKRSQKPWQAVQAPAESINPGALPAECPLRPAETLNLHDTPVIDGNIIRYRPALVHPVLKRPVAFLEGFEASMLFSTLNEGLTATEIAKRWSQRMSSRQCCEILHWMWSRRLINAQHG